MVNSKASERGTAETVPAPEHDPADGGREDMPGSKSTKSPAFQFYPSDFLSSEKVARMSFDEIGMYTVLLCHAWLACGLPNDVTALAKMLKVNVGKFTKIWKRVLSECFVERHGRLVNLRQEVERKKQADFRRKQKDKAASRWQPPGIPSGNAAALPAADVRHSRGNALLSSSSSSEGTDTHTARARGPLHASHKSCASCGRVCVPADLHNRFVRALNRDDADKVLRDWYLAVDEEWSVGPKRDVLVSGNDFQFWRARFNERWPSADAAVESKPTRARDMPYAPWECPHVEACSHRAMCEHKLNMPHKYPVKEPA